MRKSCIRCGRRGKLVGLCLSCDLFIGRQSIEGLKPEALKRAKEYARTGELSRMAGRPTFKATSTSKRTMVGRVYRTSEQACTCPSGIYRGLTGPSCKHSFAVQLINRKSER